MSAAAARYRLDKRLVRRRFNRAAPDYPRFAAVERELESRLLEHLDPIRLSPSRILDVGTGHATLARAVARRFRGAEVIALDLAVEMLRGARRRPPRLFSRERYVCGDMEALPVADATIDLVVSNATLCWVDTPDRAFAEFARVLAPGGLLLFSSLGPATLRELRESWAEVDRFVHVHAFADMHDIGDALVRAGFADVVMDADRLETSYADLADLHRSLRGLGSTNASAGRGPGLTGQGRLRALGAAYGRLKRTDGTLPATIEGIYAHAWRPAGRTTLAVPFDAGSG